MKLSEKQKKYLRRLAHSLNPVVILADAGLSTNVRKELEQALTYHELIKVRVRAGDREVRDNWIAEIAESTQSALVQRVGHTAVFYRRNHDNPRITLPRRTNSP